MAWGDGHRGGTGNVRRRPLLQGAVMLMAAGAATRAIGTMYRIVIVRWAGPEALRLYQMVMPVYRLASAMATLRLPLALTPVTAKELARRNLDEEIRARRA